jgi:hypothetical protein
MLGMFCILDVVQLSGCKQLTQMHMQVSILTMLFRVAVSCMEILVVASPARMWRLTNLPIRYFSDQASTCAVRDRYWLDRIRPERVVEDVVWSERFTANLLFVAGQQASSIINRVFNCSIDLFFLVECQVFILANKPTKLLTRYSLGTPTSGTGRDTCIAPYRKRERRTTAMFLLPPALNRCRGHSTKYNLQKSPSCSKNFSKLP